MTVLLFCDLILASSSPVAVDLPYIEKKKDPSRILNTELNGVPGCLIFKMNGIPSDNPCTNLYVTCIDILMLQFVVDGSET